MTTNGEDPQEPHTSEAAPDERTPSEREARENTAPRENKTRENKTIVQKILEYRPDFLIVLILIAIVAAIIIPVHGQGADIGNMAVTVAIAFLFFLYGARLHPKEALQGLMHWKLHLTIVIFTFVVFPLIGLAFRPLSAVVGRTCTSVFSSLLLCRRRCSRPSLLRPSRGVMSRRRLLRRVRRVCWVFY